MNEVVTKVAHRPFADKRWDRVPLYRWWRLAVIRTVDHEDVMARVDADSGWSANYAFMTMMSAGIAILGLLLSSPAVVIGAMLISPLMSPILALGFSLALFDFTEMRRSLTALTVGAVLAVAFACLIVLLSPLKAATAEILSRTRPNLFDLLVAMFSALAGTFAVIRGRGATIVGVAIATALMPPLAVVGYGLATWNVPILLGSLALFVTNFVAIALSAMVMARLYGFGHFLSRQQSWTQTVMLVLLFVAMAVPLALALGRIAREALTASEVRSFLSDRFGADARVTQLDIDYDSEPVSIRSVVIAPRARAMPSTALKQALERSLGFPVALHVDQVLLDPNAGPIAAQRTELAEAKAAKAASPDAGAAIARMVAMAAGLDPAAVVVDRDRQRIVARALPLAGADLATYRALEARAAALADDWQVELVPPFATLPTIAFANNADTLDPPAREAVLISAWAARRWNLASLGVPGLPAESDVPKHPLLAQRRALAIAALLRAQDVNAAAWPASGQSFRLSAIAAPTAPTH